MQHNIQVYPRAKAWRQGLSIWETNCESFPWNIGGVLGWRSERAMFFVPPYTSSPMRGIPRYFAWARICFIKSSTKINRLERLKSIYLRFERMHYIKLAKHEIGNVFTEEWNLSWVTKSVCDIVPDECDQFLTSIQPMRSFPQQVFRLLCTWKYHLIYLSLKDSHQHVFWREANRPFGQGFHISLGWFFFVVVMCVGGCGGGSKWGREELWNLTFKY